MVMPDNRELAEYKVAVALWKYMSPCLMLLGLVGNTLSFVVLSKSSMRKTTTSLYLRFLAVFDSLVLYSGLMRHWIIYITVYDIREYNSAVCKIHTVIPSTILTICNTSIIYKVVSSSRHILQNDSSSGNSIQRRSVSSRRNKASFLTAMLLTTSFTYVVCTTPFCIYSIYKKMLGPSQYDTPQDKAVDELVRLVVNMLQYTNNCINFMLYCVSGKRFRDELSVLCSRQERRRFEIYSVRVKDQKPGFEIRTDL
ncbi:B2 bradykinin receptor-like [Gigantopelta aegis]|uniref:B2 bradykinin receptor-like n=1 Tax=Gigantopelta aegis TaxID=1735272 RepID=UPI001B88E6A6|nr:B2 bradykinin receptor-like [Gigantopelta aegis]